MAAGILGLPTELHFRILDFADPGTHLPLGLTCTTFYAVARSVLQHHCRCYRQYRVQSDILPLSTLGILRTSLRDPIAAWHVRDLEFWSTRRCWRDWTAYKLCDETRSLFFTLARDYHAHRDTTPVSYADAGKKGLLHSEHDLFHFREILRSELCLDEDTIFSWSTRIAIGDEEPLRMILFTLLPRLRSIKYMKCRIRLDGTFGTYYDNYPLDLMMSSIENLCDLGVPKDQWPLGMRSLQLIAIDILTGLTSHVERALPVQALRRYNLRIRAINSVLTLPSLKELCVPVTLAHPIFLYPRNLDFWPPEFSVAGASEIAIEKLCFHNLGCSGPRPPSDYHVLRAFLRRSPKLKCFHIGGEFERGDDLFDVLVAHHSATLESLEIDCDERRFLVYGELRRFSRLRHIVIHLDWLRSHPGPRSTTGNYKIDVRQMDHVASLGDIFPASTVTVTFSGNTFTQFMSFDWEQKLDELVANTILYRTLPHLKAVFLGSVLKIGPTAPYAEYECNLQWRRSLAVGNQGAVDVFGTGTHDYSYITKRIRELGVTRFTSSGDVMTDPRRNPTAWRKRSDSAATAALLCKIIRMSKEL